MQRRQKVELYENNGRYPPGEREREREEVG